MLRERWCLYWDMVHNGSLLMGVFFVSSHSARCSILSMTCFMWYRIILYHYPENKVNGANMGPIWVLSAPDGPMLSIRVYIESTVINIITFTNVFFVISAFVSTASSYSPLNLLFLGNECRWGFIWIDIYLYTHIYICNKRRRFLCAKRSQRTIYICIFILWESSTLIDIYSFMLCKP